MRYRYKLIENSESYETYNPQPAKPKAGIPYTETDSITNESGTSYYHVAEFFCQDEDGNYLSPDSITYSVYFDNALYTFRNSYYFDTFTEDVTEVPLNLSSSRFNNYLLQRRIWTPDNCKRYFGVQSHYYCNGIKTSSDIVTLDMQTGELTTTPTGIRTIKNEGHEAVKTEYFLLTGTKVQQPTHGIYIVKETYADGSATSKKIYVR